MLEEKYLRLLPIECRAKPLRIESDMEASHAAILAASDALDADNLPLMRMRHRERQLIAAIQNAPTARHEQAAREALQAFQEEMAPTIANVEHRKAAKTRAMSNHDGFAFWSGVKSFMSDTLVVQLHAGHPSLKRVEPPKVTSKTPLADLQQRVWPEIEAFGPKIEAARLAPLPAKTLLERAKQEARKIAEKGAPRFDPRIRGGSPVDLVRSLEDSPGEFVAWLFQDQLEARLSEMIGSRDLPGALSDADRERAIAKLEAEKLQLERVEEALVVLAESMGQHIPRRRDCDPRAVLEVM